MGVSYIIEHMEEDEDTPATIPRWVELEYTHMRSLAGPDAQLHFAHLSHSSRETLGMVFEGTEGTELASAFCHTAGVLELIKESMWGTASSSSSSSSLETICLLDPKSETELSPQDGDGRFGWFLFGGILGDDPPRDRTAELRALRFPTRHLGPVQMTTDTAVGVTKRVIQDKVPLTEIPYIDYPTITFNPRESVEMPFRYIAVANLPLLPPGMRELIYEDLNKSFEF